MKLSIKKILVPTDFSDLSLDALDGAVFMAKKLGGEIYLLHILENSSFNSTIEKMLTLSRNRDHILNDAIVHNFNEIKESIKKKSGIDIHTITGTGRIHQAIADKAEEIGADVILMTTHGVSGMDRFLLGSTANRVIGNSKCPVITFTENPSNPGLDKIILPLDLSRETREKVDASIQIAKNFNASIDVIEVMHSDDPAVVKKLNLQLKQVENYIKEVNIPCTAQILKGDDPVETIITYAKENKGDLIMIMTNDESITDFFISSQSQKIINNSPIPVCSIRPRERKDTTSFMNY